MAKIIGIVLNTETTQGEKKDGGKWVRYAYQVKDTDGETAWYSTFEGKSFGAILKGKAYELDVEIKGDYKNLKNGGWKEVNAADYGLTMKDGDDERRSKEEMRWTEAYAAASRLLCGSMVMSDTYQPHIEDTKAALHYWAKFFYAQYLTADARKPIKEMAEVIDPPEEPEKPVEKPAAQRRSPRAKRQPKAEPAKSDAQSSGNPLPSGGPDGVDIDGEAEDTKPEPPGDRPANFELLSAVNKSRYSQETGEEIITMDEVNAYIKKKYKKDAVRKLSDKQLIDLAAHIKSGVEKKQNA